jgi:hypothetical protein
MSDYSDIGVKEHSNESYAIDKITDAIKRLVEYRKLLRSKELKSQFTAFSSIVIMLPQSPLLSAILSPIYQDIQMRVQEIHELINDIEIVLKDAGLFV